MAKRSAGDVKFTNVQKVMFPEAGYTKGDLLEYYAAVGEWILPHLKDRPVTVQRFPDGVHEGAVSFWQKNTPEHYPKWIKRVADTNEQGKRVEYALVNDLPTLLYFVNQGALTFHVYFSRVGSRGSLEKPDFVLFDLDPGGADFKNVVTIAKKVREILEDAGAGAYVKTSGKSGIHILSPWKKRGRMAGYDQAREWAIGIAQQVVKELSDIATMERSKSARRGRVYVDVMQNALGKHAVAPYVVRATPLATVSTPLEWKEVNAKLDPKKFTIKEVLARVRRKGDLLEGLVA